MTKKKNKKHHQFGSGDAAAGRWDAMMKHVELMAKKSVPKSQRMSKSQRAAAEASMRPADLQKREAEVLAKFAKMKEPEKNKTVAKKKDNFQVQYHYQSPLPRPQNRASCPASKPVHVRAYCRKK